MNISQQTHLDNLIGKYEKNKEGQGYPFYLSCVDYFKEEGGPEISDRGHIEVLQAFCKYVLEKEEEQ